MCVCVSSPRAGGDKTLHIKQARAAVLSDVIESNEIQLSQQVLEIQRLCSTASSCVECLLLESIQNLFTRLMFDRGSYCISHITDTI